MMRNPAQQQPDQRRRAERLRLGEMDEQTRTGLEHARQLSAQGRARDALLACRRLNDHSPGHAEILALLGTQYARLGDLEMALESLAEGLLHAPRDPVVLYNLAQVYLQAGAPVHALHSLRNFRTEVQQTQVAPEFPGAQELISTLTAFLHDEQGTAELPPSVQDHAMMAAERGRLRLMFSGDPEKAMPDLRAAIKAAPRYPQPRNNLALAYFYNAQPDQAIAGLEAILREISPDNVYALATLVFVRWASGGDAEALRPAIIRPAGLLGPQSRLLDRTRVAETGGLLGDHQLAHDLLAGEDLPQPGIAPGQVEGIGVTAAHARLLAASTANLGRLEEAATLLRDAPTLAVDPFARRLLTAFEAEEPLHAAVGGGYPYVRWDDLVALHTLRRLLVIAPAPRLSLRPTHQATPEQAAARLVETYPRLVTACGIMLWMGDPMLENLGITLLAFVGTRAADDLLEAHLRGTLGSYSGRQQAGYALLDAGRLPNGETVPFWTGTAWGEVRLFRLSRQRRDLPALQQTLGTLLARIATPDHA